MTIKKHQDDSMENHQLPEDAAGIDKTKSVDESRRRFAKSGLAASGVIFTLASRPVLANVCKSPSGFSSINASAPGAQQTCQGKLPGQWDAANKKTWPISSDAQFYVAFGCSVAATPHAKEKLNKVIKDSDDLHKYFVAALLNAAAGLTPVLTDLQVKNMFNEWASPKGYFEPTAGVKWDAGQIVTYLQSTMTL